MNGQEESNLCGEELTPPSVPEGFAVHDKASANWLVRKIVEARAYTDRVKAWAEAEVRRAQREERFFLDRYGAQLEAWAGQQIASLPRTRSLKLPAGTVGYRTEPLRLDVTDETTLIAWCHRHLPDALKVETQVLKSLVKEHIERTGECPDGGQLSGGKTRFYIR